MNFTVKKGDEVVVRCDTTHGYEYRRAKVERVTPKEGQIVLGNI